MLDKSDGIGRGAAGQLGIDQAGIEQAASGLLGRPFREHGRGPEGVDCFGVMLGIYSKLGCALPDLQYSPGEDHRLLIESYAEAFQEVEREAMAPGDVLLFQGQHGREDHVGVFLGAGRFVHASRHAGVVIVDLCRQPWGRTLTGVYRLRGDGKP